MPHLTFNDKERLIDHMYPVAGGELNFLITLMCQRYWSKSKRRYEDINTILGALEGAKLELYRLLAVPYEDKKIQENGSAYTNL